MIFCQLTSSPSSFSSFLNSQKMNLFKKLSLKLYTFPKITVNLQRISNLYQQWLHSITISIGGAPRWFNQRGGSLIPIVQVDINNHCFNNTQEGFPPSWKSFLVFIFHWYLPFKILFTQKKQLIKYLPMTANVAELSFLKYCTSVRKNCAAAIVTF